MEKDIPLKTSLEVGYLRRSCQLAGETLRALGAVMEPGITTREINRFCEEHISRARGGRALKGYRGYPAGVCTSVNQVACHGLPSDAVLRSGDLVTVDVTVELDGWYGDSAWTFLVGEGAQDARRLLKASWQATMAGIRAARAGSRLGDIGLAIETTARRYGCRVLEQFVGHGIGQEIHEEPMVLPTGEADTGQPVVPGMVFTVEPILTLGDGTTKLLDDGWSIVSGDGGLCAQFEHTVAIFGQRTEILTFPWGGEELTGEFPPYY